MSGSNPVRKALIVVLPLIVLVALVQWRKDMSPHEEATSSERPLRETEAQTATSKEASDEAQQAEQGDPEQPTKHPARGTEADSPAAAPQEAHAEIQNQEWDGDWLTSAAIEKPVMSELSATDPSYDGAIEARQLFYSFEVDLRAADPLNSEAYRALLSKHKSSNAATLRRVMALKSQGRDQDATRLYEEWSRLFELYRKQAYPQDSGK